MNNNFIKSGANKFNWPRFLKLVLRRWWLLVFAAIIGFGAVYFTQEYNKKPYYTAAAQLYISNGRLIEGTGSYYTPTDSYAAQQLVKTYNVIIRTDAMYQQVLDEYGDEVVQKMSRVSVSMVAIDETECLTLYVTADSPELAVEMCDVIVTVAPLAVKSVVNAGSATTLSKPKGAYLANPVSYRKSTIAAVGAVAVLIGIMMLVFVFDTRIKSVSDIKSHYDVPILGEIPSFDIMKDGKNGAYADAYSYGGSRKQG